MLSHFYKFNKTKPVANNMFVNDFTTLYFMSYASIHIKDKSCVFFQVFLSHRSPTFMK